MNVSITYSPSCLADFLAAVEAIKGLDQKSFSVSPPSDLSCPVSKYLVKTNASRYRRTPEGCQLGLSNLQDLEKRASLGDPIAAECLGVENPNLPQDTEESEKDSIIETFF